MPETDMSGRTAKNDQAGRETVSLEDARTGRAGAPFKSVKDQKTDARRMIFYQTAAVDFYEKNG